MFNIEKESFIKAVEAGRDIFLRFGSTRGLALLMTEIFLSVIAWTSVVDAPFCAGLGFVAFLVTTLSFHVKPHIDRKPV